MLYLAQSLRAARQLLGMSQADIEALTKIERRTIGRIESGKFKLVPRHALRLQNEFEKQGIEFVDSGINGIGIRWKRPGRFDPFRSSQIRAARAMVGVSQRDLAVRSGVDKNFIARLENDKPKAISMQMTQRLVTELAKLGVELTPEGESFGAGVRMRSGFEG